MIETLKDFTETSRVKVMTDDQRPTKYGIESPGLQEVDWGAFDKMREEFPICIDHETDTVSFKMLTKPASEGGNLNLCQLTDLVELAVYQLKKLNDFYPCRENSMSITKWEEGLMWQKKRTEDRETRGVEGLSKK